MKPKIGEYWYITTKSLRASSFIILAKCVGFMGDEAIFIGIDPFYEEVEIVYGSLGFSYALLYKWEPNWFWKLLGYK